MLERSRAGGKSSRFPQASTVHDDGWPLCDCVSLFELDFTIAQNSVDHQYMLCAMGEVSLTNIRSLLICILVKCLSCDF